MTGPFLLLVQVKTQASSMYVLSREHWELMLKDRKHVSLSPSLTSTECLCSVGPWWLGLLLLGGVYQRCFKAHWYIMVISSAVSAQPGEGVQPSRCVLHRFPVGEALQGLLSVLLHSLVVPQDSPRSINNLGTLWGSFGGPLYILFFLIDRDRSPEILTLYGANVKKSTSPPVGLSAWCSFP